MKGYKGIGKTAKKLNIDYAKALVGFATGSNGSRPEFDGVIVCTEFVDILKDAHRTLMYNTAKKKALKVSKLAVSNWKRLTLAILTRVNRFCKYD